MHASTENKNKRPGQASHNNIDIPVTVSGTYEFE